MHLRVFAALVALCSIAAAPGTIAKFKAVAFADTTPLARNGQLIKRLLSPFAAADLAKKNDAAALNNFPIDPKNEKFGLYVPTEKPADGYGLLVWVSPLDGAGMPLGWPATLEDRGVIFVTAERSGHYTSPLGRRIPLALTADTRASPAVRASPSEWRWPTPMCFQERSWTGVRTTSAHQTFRCRRASISNVFSTERRSCSRRARWTSTIPGPPGVSHQACAAIASIGCRSKCDGAKDMS